MERRGREGTLRASPSFSLTLRRASQAEASLHFNLFFFFFVFFLFHLTRDTSSLFFPSVRQRLATLTNRKFFCSPAYGEDRNICDYIKRNRDHAITELELFNGEGRNYVITRKIMQNNTSTWTLNRQNVPFKSVEAVLQKFNIMINNLCQILPQDRVQDFAKMDKKQLLEATQRAMNVNDQSKAKYVEQTIPGTELVAFVCENSQEAIASKEEELSRIRAESKNLLKKAKEATDGIPPDAPEFVTRFKEEFEKYANNLEALQDQIGEKSAMARCIEDSTSSRVLAEYEEKMKLLEELQKKLSTAKTRTSTIHQQTMELRERWLSKMQDLLATINGKFVKCFEYLQCCGTVELDLSSDPEAIENYGLNIKVKFRAEGDLQALDPFTQSGGERSLSTAIFLLSLQSVINVPFRFVDEINQFTRFVLERTEFSADGSLFCDKISCAPITCIFFYEAIKMLKMLKLVNYLFYLQITEEDVNSRSHQVLAMQLMVLNSLLMFDLVFMFFLFLVGVSCVLYYVPPRRAKTPHSLRPSALLTPVHGHHRHKTLLPTTPTLPPPPPPPPLHQNSKPPHSALPLHSYVLCCSRPPHIPPQPV
ncbi:unnamed protein product [Nesidiocoris tenuis]|uniref:Structural maintenance of chromosomes protein 5 n=3 Tax=Nesidiocoris tenuis TaxID=355587 RepID=A0A6H5HPY1_9HEMI|nr:unnamed protein product [Nesidiocoris tenuis]